ncbi:peroxisomal short-chain alcohol dehydrogenase [Fusarium acutatum]|uniref:Peroxisomal short-chain alcohol dehydrogenase n=1 Tax=Fusarium acutatum TaxID=78861 RepID=A0A8H4JGM7_9HYPO|nr:peroxisomal short-chain alcohol dehydrogenase [Fusarium acutatum]
MDIIDISRATDVTKTVHSEPYDAISTDNPKFSQAGKTILITGGGTTIGNSIGRSFVRASAERVIILGRRLEVLQDGALRLQQEAKAAGTHTKIIHRQLDITDFSAVDTFWKQMASEGISVDVFVSNAAAFPQLKPLLESGAKNMWSDLNTNFVVNVSSSIAHNYMHDVTTMLAAYAFNKSCGTMLFQMVAKDTPIEEMQITSMHPGLIWSPEWVKMGFKDDVGFDDGQYAQVMSSAPRKADMIGQTVALHGNFAVWLATPNAAFLHGRFAWASWDINELSEGPIRDCIEKDPYYLKMTIRGANP